MKNTLKILTASLLSGATSLSLLSLPAGAATRSQRRPLKPSQLLSIAVKSGSDMRSVHFTNYDHLGQATISQSGSAGIDKGYVYSTYRDGKIKGASQEVYQNGRLYLKANSLTLISFFGFKKAGAEKYGNKWIFIPKTDVAYINLTASLTISGQMQQIKIPGKVTYLKNPKLNGKKVLGIVGHPQSQGGLSETEILYTSVTKNHLPLKATLSQGKNGYADVTFTKWNSIVKITLPTQSTPIGKTGLE